MQKKKILVLATGGTIGSTHSDNGLVPGLAIEPILATTGAIGQEFDITARQILNLDSSNIQPEEWVVIARSVFEGFGEYDGIVVTHGTDTMAYSTSVLSFMLRGVPIPVVFTGSQLPAGHRLSDAPENLRCALAMAGSGVPGIFLAFDRKIILGCRAVKVRTSGFDAFESVNYPYIAQVDTGGLVIRRELVPPQTGEPRLLDSLCHGVFLIKLTPGFDPRIFDMLLEMGYRGVVIEAFGAGGLHYVHRDLIAKLERLCGAGVPVVIASQCLYERSDLSIYEVGKKAQQVGVISAGDMTTEAVMTKLIWALGQTDDPEQIRALFKQSLCGEITED